MIMQFNLSKKLGIRNRQNLLTTYAFGTVFLGIPDDTERSSWVAFAHEKYPYRKPDTINTKIRKVDLFPRCFIHMASRRKENLLIHLILGEFFQLCSLYTVQGGLQPFSSGHVINVKVFLMKNSRSK